MTEHRVRVVEKNLFLDDQKVFFVNQYSNLVDALWFVIDATTLDGVSVGSSDVYVSWKLGDQAYLFKLTMTQTSTGWESTWPIPDECTQIVGVATVELQLWSKGASTSSGSYLWVSNGLIMSINAANGTPVDLVDPANVLVEQVAEYANQAEQSAQAAQDAADAAQKVVDESMTDYLKKSGDTMQGDINMGNYNIGHIARLFGSSSATNYIQFFVQGCGGTVTKIYGTNYSGESQSVEVGNGGVTLNSTGPVNLNSGAGTINANNKRIQNVASPTASGDAATMGYVDDEISRLKESCAAAYVPISAAIRPTVSGNPILVQDSVAWPLQSLVLHGKTTQDGTPSPDNPVPLVSAGDEGQIDVTVCGANLLDISGVNFSGNNWATVQKNSDGSLTITGENPPYDYFVLGGGNISLAKGTYFVNGGGNQIYVQIGVKKGGEMTYRDHSHFTIDGTEENINFSVQCGVGQIYVNNMTIYPMLNVGSTALPFEPYTGKTITIPTPNGLPGIPVDSGGNYTDSTRQQWICDEIDVIAAEKIQRIGIIDNYNGESVGDVWMSTTGQLTTGAKVLYQLNEPVTTQIVADTLISYDGTTTAYTTSGADLTMQYVADAQKYIDNKIGAVSAAMLEE